MPVRNYDNYNFPEISKFKVDLVIRIRLTEIILESEMLRLSLITVSLYLRKQTYLFLYQ